MLKTALLFPGQGSQYIKMGNDIYDTFSSARNIFDEIDDALDFSLTQVIFGDDESELKKTTNTQPALMAVSMAILAVLEKEFGINIFNNTKYVIGHSLGEYSALCAAKSITLSDTAKILKIRASLMEDAGKTTAGSMAAVIGLSFDNVEAMVLKLRKNDVLVIANDNSDGQIVISGSVSAIKRACENYKDFGAKRVIELPVSGAFHSPFMREKSEAFSEKLSTFTIKSPQVPLVSNVKAAAISDGSEIKNLLVEQLYSGVRWRESIIYAESSGVERFIEIGAKNTLTSLCKRNAPNALAVSIDTLDDIKTFAEKA